MAIHNDLDIQIMKTRTRLMLMLIRQKDRLELMLKDHPDRTGLIEIANEQIDSIQIATDLIGEMRYQMSELHKEKSNIYKHYLEKCYELDKLKPDYSLNINSDLKTIMIGKTEFLVKS